MAGISRRDSRTSLGLGPAGTPVPGPGLGPRLQILPFFGHFCQKIDENPSILGETQPQTTSTQCKHLQSTVSCDTELESTRAKGHLGSI